MKLTKSQQECLAHLKEHNTYLHFMRAIGRLNPTSYYFSHAKMKRFRYSTVRKLVQEGYLEVFDKDVYQSHKVRLKEQK